MYLSAERFALANQAVKETFEQCSIAWQAIPHWDTGDPGQTRVPLDDPTAAVPTFLNLTPQVQPFQLTLVEANAPTPDLLLAEVIDQTVTLAQTVDGIVLPALYAGKASAAAVLPAAATLDQILAALIGARASVEDVGYRAPSCLFTNTPGLIAISALVSGLPQLGPVLATASVNSVERATTIDPALAAGKKLYVMLGRRQLIPHGGAPQASPGEEPVDLAVSVLPGLEVVGEAANNEIEVSVRISFKLRIKDADAIVAVVDP
jgi:hypothetical protein